MRTLIGLILVWASVQPLLALEYCSVCGERLWRSVYRTMDHVTEQNVLVCPKCITLKEKCFVCGLPVAINYTDLGDGRYLCERDGRTAILDAQKAGLHCSDSKRDLDRLFGRFLEFPGSNVEVKIVDRVHMDQLVRTPGFDRVCPSVMGYIRSRRLAAGDWRHEISVLGGLPKDQMAAVCAHEYGHAWLAENLPPQRLLYREAAEGFCELLAHGLMQQRRAELQLRFIRENQYTRGQIELYVEAEKSYGLYAITEWVRYGRDPLLSAEDLDAIRRLNTVLKPRRSAPVVRLALPTPARTPVPDELVVRGVLGSGEKCLALINDASLGEGESASVRVGESKVEIHCLKIEGNAVTVSVKPNDEIQVLPVKSKW